jgi:hypothetical protein
VLEDGHMADLGSVRATRSPLSSSHRPALEPLMVTSLGRTGTTWLMAMLAEHPQVVASREHPHEMKAGQYWAHALQVLSRPGDPLRSTNADLQRHSSWIGPNPYFNARAARQPHLGSWLGRRHAEALADFARRTIDDWYVNLAADQGDDGAVLFAEKCTPTHLPPLMWELYPGGKEIFLVRDFRDMVSSILAFNRRRGFAAFGRRDEEPVEDYVRRMGDHAGGLLEAWQGRGERGHLVRYEELVEDTAGSLRSLLEYAGLDAGRDSVDAMIAGGARDTPEVSRHRTSESLHDSVGRWRREGDERFREVLDEAFGDTLAAFGYGPRLGE